MELTEAASEVKYKSQRLKNALDEAYRVLDPDDIRSKSFHRRGMSNK